MQAEEVEVEIAMLPFLPTLEEEVRVLQATHQTAMVQLEQPTPGVVEAAETTALLVTQVGLVW